MDGDELKRLLYGPCKAAFERFVSLYGRENLLGFGLYTSEGFPSVEIVAATTSGRASNSHRSAEEFLFIPEEWDLMPRNGGTEQANALIERSCESGEKSEEVHPDWYDDYRAVFVSSCVGVLEQLVSDGVFGSESERDLLFITLGISDSLIPFTEGEAWSKRLNTKTMHANYAAFAARVRAQGSY